MQTDASFICFFVVDKRLGSPSYARASRLILLGACLLVLEQVVWSVARFTPPCRGGRAAPFTPWLV
jgi:hypothetical protein